MSLINKEFLSGLVRSTETIEQENGHIEHPILKALPRLISLTEAILNENPNERSFELWGKLVEDEELRKFLEENYGDHYDREPRMMLNSLAASLIYGNADFLRRISPILMNEQDISLLKGLFNWLKWENELNSGRDFLNLLKFAEICYPLLLYEKPVKEWVVDYRIIQQDFLAAGDDIKSASEVGIFEDLANFLVFIKSQKE